MRNVVGEKSLVEYRISPAKGCSKPHPPRVKFRSINLDSLLFIYNYQGHLSEENGKNYSSDVRRLDDVIFFGCIF